MLLTLLHYEWGAWAWVELAVLVLPKLGLLRMLLRQKAKLLRQQEQARFRT